jgi:Tfp pilus assembly protein PilX
MGSYSMKSAKPHTKTVPGKRRTGKGFVLIASLLMLLLLSGIAIGLLMTVNTEGKVGSTDLQNNVAYHVAEGGIEKMYSDLSAVFQNALAPTASQICAVSNTPPSMVGVTWNPYSVAPASGCSGTLQANWGQISSGPNHDLWAQIIPVNMQATAVMSGGQEVSMTRTAQVALIPVFQFGVFSESDLSFYPGSNLDFAGPVHTNGDLYPFAGTGATLTFHSKLSAFGNVVRTQLPNGYDASTNYNGTVYIPSADGDCTYPGTPVGGNCTAMALVPTTYGDGSVTGAGSAAKQPSSTYNYPTWNSFSNSTNNEIINGNYGSTAVNATGTGATKLSMPFVGGGALPNEIVRRPPAGESTTSAIGASREWNLAEIHVLLSDDPNDLPGGSGDSNNVRLANITQAEAIAQGLTAAAHTNDWGIPMATGNYVPATFGAPTSGNTYNLYFAAASNVVPSACTSSASCIFDWPYGPKQWTTNPSPALQGLQPAPMAPIYLNNGAPTTPGLCPPATPALRSGIPWPTGCPATPAYPFYAPSNANGATPYNSPTSTAWSLIDGYLRVEYRDASGNWHPVTNEWLSLGFARGLTPPTASVANPINPNAILLLQEPADRAGTGTWPSATAIAPTCSATTRILGVTYCTAWSGATPEVAADVAATAAGIAGDWAFGLTPNSPVATPPSSATPQSLTQYNWYPINFYDAREGEARDNTVTDNSCATNGVMNAVEIDVGNLSKWLAGTIPGSGTNVDFLQQNGYVLYFSDRRGMALNPHPPLGGSPAKSGDAGLEDVINRSSTQGTPDGQLDSIPANRSISPEDDNENTYLDNFGPTNMGLGFTGTTANANQNLNTQINSGTHPDPFGTDAAGDTNNRIASCSTTARKNWVSGARHVLRLVDGSLGNVPRRTDAGATLDSPGGFTVASENPLYIWGDYNTNASDALNWPTYTAPFQGDQTGHSAAAVIADAVTLLSVDWTDLNSMVGNVTNLAQRNPSHDGYFRLAIAGGKNINFQLPTFDVGNANARDFGTDGGVHNFLRYLETWSGQTLHYKGSLVSLFYATYGTGTFKCCQVVYGVPTRAFFFDLDFSTPGGLPPGTPMFRDVESLGYRQLFTTRNN